MRKLILAASMLAPLTLAAPAMAMPDNAYYYEYYFDAAHTSWAGERIMTCSGRTTSNGVVTAHRVVIFFEDCRGPDCSNEMLC